MRGFTPQIAIKEVDAREFYAALSICSMPWVMTPHTFSELKAMDANRYLVSNNSAGFILKHDGELISLFNESGIRGLGRVLLQRAIEMGARSLFCFDGHLVNLYTAFGFVEYKRVRWDDALAPSTWPDSTRPDVVYLQLKEREVINNAF